MSQPPHVYFQQRASCQLFYQDVIEGILNLDVAAARSEEFLRYASGGALMVGSEPLAHRYGGHQVSSGVN